MTKTKRTSSDANLRNELYTPAPYDIEFDLNIMTKYNEDGTKILEQIVPFFKPDVTVSARLIDKMDLYYDIPIVLNSVSMEDAYEGDFLQRRALIWTLSFTLKGYFFGPVSDRKVIKFVQTNLYDQLTDTVPDSILSVRPGLTAQRVGTTDIEETIPYEDISIDDDWKFIVQSVENV